MKSKVVLILIDGLRPDALGVGHSPHIDQLCRRGAYTMRAQSVMPSITLPCHMSIFYSVPPTRHGVTTNTWSPMARPLPGLIEQSADLHSAFFYCWEPLKNLNAPETLNFSYFYYRADMPFLAVDHKIASAAMAYINDEQPDFAFVYFHTLDMTGHDDGWMSPQYWQAVSEIDQLVGDLLASLPAGYAVILQSDHGGHDRNHGTDSPEDLTIPWIIEGVGIKANHAIQRPMSLLDTTPMIAHLLGIAPHADWEGTYPDEIFV